MNSGTRKEQTEKDSLGKRAAKAGAWSIFHAVCINALRLGSNLVMTRLLVPEAFGLMALIGVLLSGFSLFTDIGIHRSIVREKDGDRSLFLRVAWVVKISRGGIIAASVLLVATALWFLAPTFAPEETVYADPLLPLLIAVSAVVPLLMGFASTNVELAMRNLRMELPAFLEIGSQVLTILSMVLFAWFNPTVWALIAGMIVGAITKSLGSHLFMPGPKMAFQWDAEIASRLWRYGKWLMGSSFFTFFAMNTEKLLLGALIDSKTFGILVIALVWIEAGVTLLGRLSDGVGFPVISEVMRTRPSDVPRLYRKLQTIVDGFCVLAFLAMFFGAQLLVNVLYTTTYQVAGTYLAVLSLRFLAARFNTVLGLTMNLGNSFAIMVISMFRALWVCVALPIAFLNFGLLAALFVIALTQLVTAPLALWLVKPHLGPRQIIFECFMLALALCICVFAYASLAPPSL